MATEKRLIVLQDAVDIIANTPSEIANRVARGCKTHWTTKEVLGVLADRQFETFVLLDMVKRVDAVEVVHGRWIDVRGIPSVNRKDVPVVKCSKCEIYFCDLINNHHYMYHYCPNCGAKMR
jgi:hypothetical protein